MEGLKILAEIAEDEEDDIPYVDGDSLLELKITLQTFLRVNGFDYSKEPDFREMTEENFIKYYETNANGDVLEKFSDLNIRETFRSNLSDVYTHEESGKKIFVFFVPTSEVRTNVGIDTVKYFCKLIYLLGCNEGLMISEKDLTSRSRDLLDSSNVKGFYEGEDIYNVIYYTDSTFISVVDHCLAPEILHIYSGKEVINFSKQHNINIKELPRIINTDPVVKFFRGKVGDVIKFKRKTGSENTLVNEQIVFRLVVHAGVTKKK